MLKTIFHWTGLWYIGSEAVEEVLTSSDAVHEYIDAHQDVEYLLVAQLASTDVLSYLYLLSSENKIPQPKIVTPRVLERFCLSDVDQYSALLRFLRENRIPVSQGGQRPIIWDDFCFAVGNKENADPTSLGLLFCKHSVWWPIHFFDIQSHAALIYVLSKVGDPRWHIEYAEADVDCRRLLNVLHLTRRPLETNRALTCIRVWLNPYTFPVLYGGLKSSAECDPSAYFLDLYRRGLEKRRDSERLYVSITQKFLKTLTRLWLWVYDRERFLPLFPPLDLSLPKYVCDALQHYLKTLYN